MPLRFEYDLEQRLLMISINGELYDSELLQMFATAGKWAEKYNLQRAILDGTGIAGFSVTPETVKALAEQAPMLPARSDRCIVVNQDYLYGMARMYQMLGGETRERLRIVRTLPEAYDYLKLRAPLHLQPVED